MSDQIDDRTAYALSRVFDSGMRTCPGCGQDAFELEEEDGSVVQPVKVGDRYWHPGCRDAQTIRAANNRAPEVPKGRVFVELGWKGLLMEDLRDYETDCRVTADRPPPDQPFLVMVTSPSPAGEERRREIARVDRIPERDGNEYVFVLTRGLAGTNVYSHPAGVPLDLTLPDRDPREVE